MIRTTDPTRGRSRVLSPLSCCVLLSGALFLAACGRGGGDPSNGGPGDKPGAAGDKVVEAVPVEVAKVTRRAIAASYTGTAPLEARAESQVVAKTSGVALDVLVKEGEQVKAGQTVVRLDSSRAALQAAQSSAQMHKLESNYARSRKLAEQQLISANDIDQIKFDLENARAVNRMASLELSYASVKTPISGVVAQVSIKPGNFVQINSPVIRVVDISRLEATLNVPERELETLKPGLPVTLRVDALPGKAYQGTVDRVAPVVDSGSGTFRVICAFDSAGILQPGMFGRLQIDYDQRANALVLPRAALLDDEAQSAVYTIKDGKAVRTPVKLGYADGEWVELLDGLVLGQQVVTAGKVALREGSPVQVISDADKTPAKQPAAAGKDASGTGTSR